MCSLPDDRNLVIRKVDRGSCVVVWDQNAYLMEAEKQLSDKNFSTDVNFNKKLILDLTETSNKIFRNHKNGGFFTDKELKYFIFDKKRACQLEKLYFISGIHRRLFNVSAPPVKHP